MVAILAVTLVVGAAVQGLVGLGVGLVAAPVTALLEPQLMPGFLLFLALFMPIVTLRHERGDIDWHGLGWSLPARIPGTVVGVLLVSTISDRGLGVAVGVMVLCGVLLTIHAVEVPVNRLTLSAAGFVSGVTGTATSIGGPPLAVLYQHRPARQIRTTMAVYFLIGAALSLVGLLVTGNLAWTDVGLATLMIPTLVLGGLLSRVVRRRVAPDSIRAGVLVVCGASAVLLLVRSLLG